MMWSKTSINLLFLMIFLIFFSLAPVFSQTASQAQEETAAPLDLPRQFRQISLGMSLDDLKENLLKDDYFNFRGDRDVSLLPIKDQSLVETTGSTFIRRAFFQLRDGLIFIMSYSLNTDIVDFYSIFMQMSGKYGEPAYLDPRTVIWETEETRISLERPLTVKYIDKAVFDDIVNESGLVESGHVRLRQEFINEF